MDPLPIRSARVDSSRAGQVLALGLPVALAAVLRLANLGPRNTWYDEVFSMLTAEQEIPQLLTIAANDMHTPLYYLLLHYWLLLDGSLAFARALSAVLGVAALVVLYLVGHRLVGQGAAAVGAALMAVNPFQLYFAQEARMYAPLLLGELLGLYFFLLALGSGRRLHWMLTTLALVVALYSSPTAAIYLATLDLYGVFVLASAAIPALGGLRRYALPPSSARRVAAGLIATNLGVLLLFLPWLGFTLDKVGRLGSAFWIDPPGLTELIRTLIALTFNLPAPAPGALGILLATSLLLCVMVVFQAARAVRGAGEGKKGKGEKANGETDPSPFSPFPLFPSPALVFLLAMWTLPPLLLFLLSQVRPMYVERALLASGAVYCLLLGWLFLTLRPRLVAGGLALAYVALAAWSVQSYYSFDAFPRLDYRAPLSYVRDHFQPGDAVVHDNKLSFFPFYYLDRAVPATFVPDPEDARSNVLPPSTQDLLGLHPTPLPESVAGSRRTWFLIYRQALDEAAQRGAVHPNKSWLDARYRLVDEVRFGDLSIYLYETGPPAAR